MINSNGKLKLPEIRNNKSRNNSCNKSSTLDAPKDENITLFEIKQHRKLIENDAYMLVNRLKILRQEESKIRKNVENIQKKAADILESKAKKGYEMRQSKSLEKFNIDSIKDEEYRKRRLEELDRYQQKARIEEKINNIHILKEHEFHQIKEQLKNNHMIRKSANDTYLKYRMEKNMKVKAEEVLVLEKKKEFLNDKIEKIKETKLTEIEEELNNIEKFKKELEMLSKEEDLMLNNIDKVTNLQHEVFEKLGEVKSMPADEAYERFNSQNTSKSRIVIKPVHHSKSTLSDESGSLSSHKKTKSMLITPTRPLNSENIPESFVFGSNANLKRQYLDISAIKKVYFADKKSLKNKLNETNKILSQSIYIVEEDMSQNEDDLTFNFEFNQNLLNAIDILIQ